MTVGAKVETLDGAAPLLIVTVADTGYGIEEVNLAKIFLPFFTARKTKGLGLGLPICARIVKNHGGRIEVKSRPGEGTLFKIYLPLAQSAAAQNQTDDLVDSSNESSDSF